MISDMRQIYGQNESLCSRLQEFSPPCFHKLGLRQCSASLMTIYNHLSPVKVKNVNMITLSWWWHYRRPLSHWTGSSSVDVKAAVTCWAEIPDMNVCTDTGWNWTNCTSDCIVSRWMFFEEKMVLDSQSAPTVLSESRLLTRVRKPFSHD